MKLTADWTVHSTAAEVRLAMESQDMILKPIIERASTQIAEEIDWMVEKDLLMECGYTKVELPTLGSNQNAVDIKHWLKHHGSSGVRQHGREFLFKEDSLAMLFKLRCNTSIDIPADRQYQAYKCAKSKLGLPGGTLGPVQNLNWAKVIWTSRTFTVDEMVLERFYFRDEKHAVWFALRCL